MPPKKKTDASAESKTEKSGALEPKAAKGGKAVVVTTPADFAPTVPGGDMLAIVGGYHGTPHTVLGPHVVERDGESFVSIRVFRPLDQRVLINELGAGTRPEVRTEMQRIDPNGFFEAIFPGRSEPFPYRIIVVSPAGDEIELEDPYRFPFLLTEFDHHLFGEGNFFACYEKLGAHFRTVDGVRGVNFAVWAPNALRVGVSGPFNGWDHRAHPMTKSGAAIWELFIPNLLEGEDYKYAIKSLINDYQIDKADPFAFYAEKRPATDSRIWDVDKYVWGDTAWMEARAERQTLDDPIAIYEVHLGSWKRVPDDNGFLSYRDLAHQLIDHVVALGYTHIELLPITEHPFDGSWGYQVTGYYAPTSRFGTPDDFKYFVDYCHQHNIGVILDWVPAHFPKDAHGLGFFDGTHLYEHEDPRRGEHRDWGTKIFNYGRNEVRNFLLGNALFWVDKYHLDGFRVDAVASMLYLDFGREAGDWLPNRYGGRENLEAIDFIRRFNELVHEQAPGVLTIAEESTSWPMVSRPTYAGGLGFSLKWNMGWMHDMLSYMKKDPVFRRYHQGQITFSLMYAFSENFVLPFSHDEVVHLKKSMLDKMPGDLWQKFANLRALYGYMYGHPGKKLLFMGGEFGQWREWSEARSLDWHLLDVSLHKQLMEYVSALNHLYTSEAALHEVDTSWEGFQWIDLSDVDNSVISFIRRARDRANHLVMICNLTPNPRLGYRVGLPELTTYTELLNSDDPRFGGSGVLNTHPIAAEQYAWQACNHSAPVNLPPLGVVVLKAVAVTVS